MEKISGIFTFRSISSPPDFAIALNNSASETVEVRTSSGDSGRSKMKTFRDSDTEPAKAGLKTCHFLVRFCPFGGCETMN